MNKYVIYRHTSPSGFVYIGQTCRIKQRFGNNGENYRGCNIFYNAIQKYGWNNIKHEILFENLSKEQADKIEIELIAEYKAKGISYNITNGGGGVVGVKWSKQSKLKASKSAKLRCEDPNEKQRLVNNLHRLPLSPEARQKISIKNSGSNNPMYGKPRPEETKVKIRAKLLGRKASEVTKAKIRNHIMMCGHPRSGAKLTPETRAKISKARKGTPSPDRGKIYINKNGICKKVRPEELESYFLDGWERGMK